jgi:RNA-binding protein YlmH
MYTTQKNLTRFQNNGHTYFLNQKEVREITSHLKKNEYTIYKPYPDSEKNILYQDQIPKVCLYEIHCSVELRHQDILGTMYSLNISDDLFGDIVLVENHYYIYILPIVQNYFEMNFQQVRNCKVEVEEISLSTLEEYHRDYEVLEFIVSSLRIDNVLASILHTSRGNVIDTIQDKQVFLNYDVLTKYDYKLKEGDIFSIRKVGKYRFDQVLKMTKQDHYIIQISRYI